MTREPHRAPAAPTDLVPWSSVQDWAPIAALLGRDLTALRAEVAALPDGIEGVALLAHGAPAAVGLWVEKGLDEAGARELVLRVAASNALARALYEAEGWTERWRRGAWERAL